MLLGRKICLFKLFISPAHIARNSFFLHEKKSLSCGNFNSQQGIFREGLVLVENGNSRKFVSGEHERTRKKNIKPVVEGGAQQIRTKMVMVMFFVCFVFLAMAFQHATDVLFRPDGAHAVEFKFY